MSDAGPRAQRTAEKTALGGLPAPFDSVVVSVGIGVGASCAGCGEAVGPAEKLYTVNLFAALFLEFHGDCYESWHTFKTRDGKTAEPRRSKSADPCGT